MLREKEDEEAREMRNQKKGARPKRLGGASRLETAPSFSSHPSVHHPPTSLIIHLSIRASGTF